MALFATGRHPINLDKGLHTPVGSRAQGGSLSTTEPFPPYCNLLLCTQGQWEEQPSSLLSTLPQPSAAESTALGEPREGHGNKAGPRAAVPPQNQADSWPNEPCLGFDFFPRFSAALATLTSRSQVPAWRQRRFALLRW